MALVIAVLLGVVWIALVINIAIYTVFLTLREIYVEDTLSVKGKTIWLVWLQGWDQAPWLVQQVRKSWEQLNPGWNVELVSEANLKDYVRIPYLDSWQSHIISPAAKSDIIRLHLLAEHGGVWADATMLCMMPLDNWIYAALEPTGFWMYHGRDYGRGPASWFMISMRGSPIIRAWCNAADDFWTQRQADYNYFWMDELFDGLLKSDRVVAEEWQRVPYLWCDAKGQAHMLAGKCFDDTPELKQILKHNPPYALKLTRHGWDENVAELGDAFTSTNAYSAITYALQQEHAPYPLHDIQYPLSRSSTFSDSVMVSPDCGAKNEIEVMSDFCTARGMQLLVYDKCNFCKNVPDYVYCRPLQNVGRDMHTSLYFIAQYYDKLPNNIAFLPSNIYKWGRLQRIEVLLDSHDVSCRGGTLGNQRDFTLSEYEGVPLKEADTRPFKSWYEKYVGSWNPDKEGPCWNGVMKTTRELILRKPREFYLNILNQLTDQDSLETVHYVERSMAAIFH